jgi:hypothetical protein
MKLAILAPIVFLAASANAQDTSQWANVRTLRPGDRVGVVKSDQKRVEGRFVSVTDNAIFIRTEQEVTVAKQDTVRVYHQTGMKRLHRVLIGAGAGVAAGAILSGTIGDRFRNEGSDPPSGAWIAGAVGVGAVVGALTGGGYHEIYRKTLR